MAAAWRPDVIYAWSLMQLFASLHVTLRDSGVPVVYAVQDHWLPQQLARSRELIRQRAGVEVSALSYPHGRFDARVVEIGCGTGQLTNFLAIAHRSVLGTDMCGNSLALAHQFATKHGIDRAAFARAT